MVQVITVQALLSWKPAALVCCSKQKELKTSPEKKKRARVQRRKLHVKQKACWWRLGLVAGCGEKDGGSVVVKTRRQNGKRRQGRAGHGR